MPYRSGCTGRMPSMSGSPSSNSLPKLRQHAGRPQHEARCERLQLQRQRRGSMQAARRAEEIDATLQLIDDDPH